MTTCTVASPRAAGRTSAVKYSDIERTRPAPLTATNGVYIAVAQTMLARWCSSTRDELTDATPPCSAVTMEPRIDWSGQRVTRELERKHVGGRAQRATWSEAETGSGRQGTCTASRSIREGRTGIVAMVSWNPAMCVNGVASGALPSL